jgi:hypothetical protein
MTLSFEDYEPMGEEYDEFEISWEQIILQGLHQLEDMELEDPRTEIEELST